MTIRHSMNNRGGNLATNRYLAAIQTNVTESTSSSTASSNIPTSTPTSNKNANNFHKRQRPRSLTNNGSVTPPPSFDFQQQQQHFFPGKSSSVHYHHNQAQQQQESGNAPLQSRNGSSSPSFTRKSSSSKDCLRDSALTFFGEDESDNGHRDNVRCDNGEYDYHNDNDEIMTPIPAPVPIVPVSGFLGNSMNGEDWKSRWAKEKLKRRQSNNLIKSSDEGIVFNSSSELVARNSGSEEADDTQLPRRWNQTQPNVNTNSRQPPPSSPPSTSSSCQNEDTYPRLKPFSQQQQPPQQLSQQKQQQPKRTITHQIQSKQKLRNAVGHKPEGMTTDMVISDDEPTVMKQEGNTKGFGSRDNNRRWQRPKHTVGDRQWMTNNVGNVNNQSMELSSSVKTTDDHNLSTTSNGITENKENRGNTTHQQDEGSVIAISQVDMGRPKDFRHSDDLGVLCENANNEETKSMDQSRDLANGYKQSKKPKVLQERQKETDSAQSKESKYFTTPSTTDNTNSMTSFQPKSFQDHDTCGSNDITVQNSRKFWQSKASNAVTSTSAATAVDKINNLDMQTETITRSFGRKVDGATSFENNLSSTIRNITHLNLIDPSSSSDDKFDGKKLDQVKQSKKPTAGIENNVIDTPASNITSVRQSEKNDRGESSGKKSKINTSVNQISNTMHNILQLKTFCSSSTTRQDVQQSKTDSVYTFENKSSPIGRQHAKSPKIGKIDITKFEKSTSPKAVNRKTIHSHDINYDVDNEGRDMCSKDNTPSIPQHQLQDVTSIVETTVCVKRQHSRPSKIGKVDLQKFEATALPLKTFDKGDACDEGCDTCSKDDGPSVPQHYIQDLKNKRSNVEVTGSKIDLSKQSRSQIRDIYLPSVQDDKVRMSSNKPDDSAKPNDLTDTFNSTTNNWEKWSKHRLQSCKTPKVINKHQELKHPTLVIKNLSTTNEHHQLVDKQLENTTHHADSILLQNQNQTDPNLIVQNNTDVDKNPETTKIVTNMRLSSSNKPSIINTYQEKKNQEITYEQQKGLSQQEGGRKVPRKQAFHGISRVDIASHKEQSYLPSWKIRSLRKVERNENTPGIENIDVKYNESTGLAGENNSKLVRQSQQEVSKQLSPKILNVNIASNTLDQTEQSCTLENTLNKDNDDNVNEEQPLCEEESNIEFMSVRARLRVWNRGKVIDGEAIDSEFSCQVPDAGSTLCKKGNSETNRLTQQCNNNTQEKFGISDDCHQKVTLEEMKGQSLRSPSKLSVSKRLKAKNILNRKNVNNLIAHEGQHTNDLSIENSGLGKSDECQGFDGTWRSYEKSLNGMQQKQGSSLTERNNCDLPDTHRVCDGEIADDIELTSKFSGLKSKTEPQIESQCCVQLSNGTTNECDQQVTGCENADISGTGKSCSLFLRQTGMIDNTSTPVGRSSAFSKWDKISKSEDTRPCRNSSVEQIPQGKDKQKEAEMIGNTSVTVPRSSAFRKWDRISKSKDASSCRNSILEKEPEREDNQKKAGKIDNMNATVTRSSTFKRWDTINKSKDASYCRSLNVDEELEREHTQNQILRLDERCGNISVPKKKENGHLANQTELSLASKPVENSINSPTTNLSALRKWCLRLNKDSQNSSAFRNKVSVIKEERSNKQEGERNNLSDSKDNAKVENEELVMEANLLSNSVNKGRDGGIEDVSHESSLLVEKVLNIKVRKDFSNPASRNHVARMAAAFSATSQTDSGTNIYKNDVDKPDKNTACMKSGLKSRLTQSDIIVSPLSNKKLADRNPPLETDRNHIKVDATNKTFINASASEKSLPPNSGSDNCVEAIFHMGNESKDETVTKLEKAPEISGDDSTKRSSNRHHFSNILSKFEVSKKVDVALENKAHRLHYHVTPVEIIQSTLPSESTQNINEHDTKDESIGQLRYKEHHKKISESKEIGYIIDKIEHAGCNSKSFKTQESITCKKSSLIEDVSFQVGKSYKCGQVNDMESHTTSPSIVSMQDTSIKFVGRNSDVKESGATNTDCIDEKSTRSDQGPVKMVSANNRGFNETALGDQEECFEHHLSLNVNKASGKETEIPWVPRLGKKDDDDDNTSSYEVNQMSSNMLPMGCGFMNSSLPMAHNPEIYGNDSGFLSNKCSNRVEDTRQGIPNTDVTLPEIYESFCLNNTMNSYDEDDCDGVTLSPRTSDVSSLSIPSCLQDCDLSCESNSSSDEDTGAMESATEKQSNAKGPSEASSSQSSEAATPLIHSTLGTLNMKLGLSSISDAASGFEVYRKRLLDMFPSVTDDSYNDEVSQGLLLQRSHIKAHYKDNTTIDGQPFNEPFGTVSVDGIISPFLGEERVTEGSSPCWKLDQPFSPETEDGGNENCANEWAIFSEDEIDDKGFCCRSSSEEVLRELNTPNQLTIKRAATSTYKADLTKLETSHSVLFSTNDKVKLQRDTVPKNEKNCDSVHQKSGPVLKKSSVFDIDKCDDDLVKSSQGQVSNSEIFFSATNDKDIVTAGEKTLVSLKSDKNILNETSIAEKENEMSRKSPSLVGSNSRSSPTNRRSTLHKVIAFQKARHQTYTRK